VYGSFGQTLVYVKKEGERFLLIEGDEKTSDEALFEAKYGFRVGQFIDDLAMKVQREATPGGWTAERGRYRVAYGQDRRGRKRICWEGGDGSICLAFDEISFTGQ
jgi:hypothetical protein